MGAYARPNQNTRTNADYALVTATALVELGQSSNVRSPLIDTNFDLVNVPKTFVSSNPYYVGGS